MDKNQNPSLLKRGIWIKEQQGTLTMGSLDDGNKDIMVVPDSLSAKIFEFEEDMIEALYGESRVPFKPGPIDIEELLSNIERRFSKYNLKTSFSNPNGEEFKGDYDKVFKLLKRLVQSSITDNGSGPVIYINASMLQSHLCIIYRDSDSISDPAGLGDEFQAAIDALKGEASYKKTSKDKNYYDIMIPSET